LFPEIKVFFRGPLLNGANHHQGYGRALHPYLQWARPSVKIDKGLLQKRRMIGFKISKIHFCRRSIILDKHQACLMCSNLYGAQTS
jgi:hypothetical protein